MNPGKLRLASFERKIPNSDQQIANTIYWCVTETDIWADELCNPKYTGDCYSRVTPTRADCKPDRELCIKVSLL